VIVCRVSAEAVDRPLGIDQRGNTAGKLVGDIDARGNAVHPGGAVLGEAFGRRRPPQRLTQQILRLDHRADVRRRDPDRAQRADEPCARRL